MEKFSINLTREQVEIIIDLLNTHCPNEPEYSFDADMGEVRRLEDGATINLQAHLDAILSWSKVVN